MAYKMRWNLIVFKVSPTGGNAGVLADVGYTGLAETPPAGQVIIHSQSKAISMCMALINRFQNSLFVNVKGKVGAVPFGSANPGQPDLTQEQKFFFYYNDMDSPNPALLLALKKANGGKDGDTPPDDNPPDDGQFAFGNFTDVVPETDQGDGGSPGVITG